MKSDDVFRKHSRQIYVTALTYVKNRSDAEDILQDVFVAFLSQNRAFESEEHLRNWLLKVTVNRSKNVLRSPWRKRCEWPEEDFAEEKDLSEEATRALDVRRAVMRLPEKLRLAVILYYYDQLSAKDAARVAGISESAFKVRLHRGREALREILGEDYENEIR